MTRPDLQKINDEIDRISDARIEHLQKLKPKTLIEHLQFVFNDKDFLVCLWCNQIIKQGAVYCQSATPNYFHSPCIIEYYGIIVELLEKFKENAEEIDKYNLLVS